MKCALIYNPNSGSNKLRHDKYRNKLIKKLAASNYEVTCYPTEYPGHSTVIARRIALKKEYNYIIASGGDGTVSEVTNALYDIENHPNLVVFPSGTCNDVAKSLKIKKGMKFLLKMLNTGTEKKMDIGEINKKTFIYVTGIGAFTEVSYEQASKVKKALGYVAYILGFFKKIITYRIRPIDIEIRVDGEVRQEKIILLLLMNSVRVAGNVLSKSNKYDDANFSLLYVKYRKGTNYLRLFFAFVLKIKRNKFINTIESDNFELITDSELNWVIDGEEESCGSKHIKIIPNAINILVPDKGLKYFV